MRAACLVVGDLTVNLNTVDHTHLNLAYRRGQSYLFGFRRIANLGRAGLILYDRTNANSVSAKVCRNSDRERETHRSFVHVDRAFREVKFSVCSARIADRADTNACAAKSYGRRDGVLTARPI